MQKCISCLKIYYRNELIVCNKCWWLLCAKCSGITAAELIELLAGRRSYPFYCSSCKMNFPLAAPLFSVMPQMLANPGSSSEELTSQSTGYYEPAPAPVVSQSMSAAPMATSSMSSGRYATGQAGTGVIYPGSMTPGSTGNTASCGSQPMMAGSMEGHSLAGQSAGNAYMGAGGMYGGSMGGNTYMVTGSTGNGLMSPYPINAYSMGYVPINAASMRAGPINAMGPGYGSLFMGPMGPESMGSVAMSGGSGFGPSTSWYRQGANPRYQWVSDYLSLNSSITEVQDGGEIPQQASPGRGREDSQPENISPATANVSQPASDAAESKQDVIQPKGDGQFKGVGEFKDVGQHKNVGQSTRVAQSEGVGESKDVGQFVESEDGGEFEDVGHSGYVTEYEDGGEPEVGQYEGESEDVDEPRDSSQSQSIGQPKDVGQPQYFGQFEDVGKFEEVDKFEDVGKFEDVSEFKQAAQTEEDVQRKTADILKYEDEIIVVLDDDE